MTISNTDINFVDKEWKLFLEYKNKNTCFDQYYKDIYSIFEHKTNNFNLCSPDDNIKETPDLLEKRMENISLSNSFEDTSQINIIDTKNNKTKRKNQTKIVNNNVDSAKLNINNLSKTCKENIITTSTKNKKNNQYIESNIIEENDDISDCDENNSIVENITNIGAIMELYISTQTKIAFLNKQINIYDVFWKIPLIKYDENKYGIIKKQIICRLNNEDALKELTDKYNIYKENGFHVDDYIIKNIINPNGRIKYKSVRKLSIGLNKKDLNGKKNKKKGAFFNCFVLILRYNDDDDDENINNISSVKNNEYHIKIFNTGKIEIPGIQKSSTFNKILDVIINLLEPILNTNNDNDNDKKESLNYFEDTEELVIINSNFYCGFEINREKLYELLKDKYGLQVIYDSCSYPGIKCRFYYNLNLPPNEQTGIYYSSLLNSKSLETKTNFLKISFMIFRTGKILIVGKCHERILRTCFNYLCNLLNNEYENIRVKNISIL